MNTSEVFYRCMFCGNIVGLIKDGGGELVCCGKPMKKLQANTSDASEEKHVPATKREKGKIVVQVGSAIHPMTEEHYIEWIAVVYEGGMEIISLSPSDEPKGEFGDRKNVEVFAYCNLHGLWKAKLD